MRRVSHRLTTTVLSIKVGVTRRLAEKHTGVYYSNIYSLHLTSDDPNLLFITIVIYS